MHVTRIIQSKAVVDGHFARPAFGRCDANEAISDREIPHFGTARFLEPEELLLMPELSAPDPNGFSDLAGEVLGGQYRQPAAPVFLNGAGLTLTFGAPGAGKSTQISTNLLRPRKDSFIVLDLKGELHARCAPYIRQQGMDVHVHSLFFGADGATFNPLQAIPGHPSGAFHRTEAAIRIQTELENLARDVVQQSLDQPFWVNAERSLFQTLAGYVLSAALARSKQERVAQPWRVRVRSMAEVRRLLTLTDDDRRHLIADGLLRSQFPQLRDGAKEWIALITARETYAAVHSDLLEQLKPWAHPVIDHASRSCSYDFTDLRRRPTAVFVQVPPAQIRLCKSWLRAYFGTALRHLMYDTTGCPVSFYLDESALLGTMESFDEVIGAIRGYRLRLNCFYQSLGQLKASYPKTWETWLSTAFAKIYFGINDVDTAEWISRSVGDSTIAVPSFQVGQVRAVGSTATNTRSEGSNSYSAAGVSENRSMPDKDPEAGSQGSGMNFSVGGGSSSTVTESQSNSTTTSNSDGTHWTYAKRRLIDATEVMTLANGWQIIQTPRGPILAHMARYFENPVLLERAADSADGQLPSPSFAVETAKEAAP